MYSVYSVIEARCSRYTVSSKGFYVKKLKENKSEKCTFFRLA